MGAWESWEILVGYWSSTSSDTDAAERLGITVDAVHARIKRETLDVEREEGRVWVLLDDDQTGTGCDQQTDHGAAQHGEPDALITQLRDEITYLREENRRKDHLLAAALERIPPALEPPGSPESPGPTAMPLRWPAEARRRPLRSRSRADARGGGSSSGSGGKGVTEKPTPMPEQVYTVGDTVQARTDHHLGQRTAGAEHKVAACKTR